MQELKILYIDKDTKLTKEDIQKKYDRVEFYGDVTLRFLCNISQCIFTDTSEIVVFGRILITDNTKELSKITKEELC